MPEEEIIQRAAVDDEGEAKKAIEELADPEHQFVQQVTGRGLMINSSFFGEFADFVYYSCDWPKYFIKSSLKHYEGWGNHDWA